MEAIAETPLKIERCMPMRVMGKSDEGISLLRCTYDWHPDDSLSFQHLNGNPQIVHIQAQSEDEFIRNFLYSQSSQRKHIFTMSGYKDDFPIEVYSWKARKFPHLIELSEKEAIELITDVEMTHVQGLERAVEQHKRKIFGLDLNSVSLEETKRVYEAVLYHIPSLK